MNSMILDGKVLSKEIKEDIKKEVEKIKKTHGRVPGLAVVHVGDDPGSASYVKMKEKACAEIGIYSEMHKLSAEIEERQLLDLIDSLNQNDKIDGILVQLPLPKDIDELKVTSRISPAKDVDGVNPVNSGKLFLGQDGFIPCTPKGIVKILKSTNVQLQGKHIVIVGRSNIVGKPAALLMLNENATVTLCHSKTQNLAEHLRKADIVIVAVGKPELIKGELIKEKAIVIDAGINLKDGKIVGDVDFESVSKKASWITPVPGGVGPMTIAMLLENTLEGFKKRWK